MSESSDYTPAPWAAGHDFASARRGYMDKVVGRGAVAPETVGLTINTLAPDKLICQAENPLIIVCDVTGSMGEWPGVIFSKLPYLEFEGKEYLGQDMQIAFAAVGDADKHDKYPLQVQPFAEGAKLKVSLEKLIIEGGGGGGGEESYDLAALYFARNCECPNAIRKPILIFIGDEGIYNYCAKESAEQWAKVKTDKRIDVGEVFKELTSKYAVYVVRKLYGGTEDNPSSQDQAIRTQWVGYLGEDHVVNLPIADRVVDVIFGILAKETGRLNYFRKELEDRQGKDKGGKAKIEVVLKSLRTVHSPASIKKLPAGTGKSVTRRKTGATAKKSISLADDE
jgi:hypothetical protein